MIQCREGVSLLFKADRKLRIVRTLRREQFQGDQSVQGLLPCLVNDAHAATAEAFQYFQLREMRGEFLRCEGGPRRYRFTVMRRLDNLRHETTRTLLHRSS